METVKEKIHEEYEIFFLDMSRTSRANIFACSREIEIKKSILFYISDQKFTKEQEKLLLACDNLLEEVYRYVMDYMPKENEQAVEFAKKWTAEKVG